MDSGESEYFWPECENDRELNSDRGRMGKTCLPLSISLNGIELDDVFHFVSLLAPNLCRCLTCADISIERNDKARQCI